MFNKNAKSGNHFLIVGLGNPGVEYEKTRHNAGFMALDALFSKTNPGVLKHKFDATFCDIKLNNATITAAKPQTYMNLSGKAVVALANFYKIPKEKIIIISDDISLPVGNIRIRRKGSAGGHNGLKDIFELMGSDEIARIKVGVGERKEHSENLANHVLGKIPEDQLEDFNKALNNAADAVIDIIENGIDHAMNKFSK